MFLKVLFNAFGGKSEYEVLDEIEKFLLGEGFTRTVANNRGVTTVWFSKKDAENVFALSVRRDKSYLPVIMPADFAYKHYTKNGVLCKNITLSTHSYENNAIVPVINHDGKKNVRLHRVIMMEKGINIDGMEIDHISCHEGVDVLEELRLCTSKQNKSNKKNVENYSDSNFKYNDTHDFRDSIWIPVLHYVLGIISKEDMYSLRKMELAV